MESHLLKVILFEIILSFFEIILSPLDRFFSKDLVNVEVWYCMVFCSLCFDLVLRHNLRGTVDELRINK